MSHSKKTDVSGCNLPIILLLFLEMAAIALLDTAAVLLILLLLLFVVINVKPDPTINTKLNKTIERK